MQKQIIYCSIILFHYRSRITLDYDAKVSLKYACFKMSFIQKVVIIHCSLLFTGIKQMC